MIPLITLRSGFLLRSLKLNLFLIKNDKYSFSSFLPGLRGKEKEFMNKLRMILAISIIGHDNKYNIITLVL